MKQLSRIALFAITIGLACVTLTACSSSDSTTTTSNSITVKGVQ